ncbi:hypothetical protein NLM33_05455 [Bradyrhizobium sp. CCGUVB1N3]|uniref:hypothetical protein n=1 Tax=Bradyrhizobium sp. CCGUVB1N3 TaxID=2949629 RepID=UPI0020B35790|nr:hypothetical protein [Bradyrhizobium sp. CCGUVB1N3]MCP3469775.1 hypothetical protein [Bradyrhizobium sp. CCGUVB1N3]
MVGGIARATFGLDLPSEPEPRLPSEPEPPRRPDTRPWYKKLAETIAAILAALLFVSAFLAAYAAVGRHEEWYVPELLRLKGELMLKGTPHRSVSSAEQCFSDARQLARQQGALFWELRNAVSLARLWAAQDRKAEARQIIAHVCKTLGDSPQIADVREARALLDGLDAKE